MKRIEDEGVAVAAKAAVARIELTDGDAHQLFFAIGVAEGEIGMKFGNVKRKLRAAFPTAAAEIREADAGAARSAKAQNVARTECAKALAGALDRGKPLVPQIEAWYRLNRDDVSKHCSDEIRLSADLYSHHKEFVPALAAELRAVARGEGDEYTLSHSRTATWHKLAQLLERVDSEIRMAQAKQRSS